MVNNKKIEHYETKSDDVQLPSIKQMLEVRLLAN